MLTVFTNSFARPDYIQLLAWALRATVQEPYRFVVVVQPGGLRRRWEAVDEVVEGATVGYGAWSDALPLISGPSVILHDDCVPVLPWTREVFPMPHCSRFAGSTLFYHEGPAVPPFPVMRAARVGSSQACPTMWPASLCQPAVESRAEYLLGGVFLHLDKGTIATPESPANAAKPRLVAAIADTLGIQSPSPLTTDERAAHPGRNFPAGVDGPGLGDMVANGLAAIGITKPRVQAVASAVGLKDCGCSGRQAALNTFGRRLGIGGPPK